jgi:mRNA interferase MazF
MKEGDVVLTPLPQANGQVKNRPDIVLCAMPPYGDLLICGVSTQLRHQVAGFDETIEPNHADFVPSGLKAPSLIRLGFLAVLPIDNFLGAIGSVSTERHRRLLKKLCDHLCPPPKPPHTVRAIRPLRKRRGSLPKR